MTAIMRYDVARQAVAEAKTFDDVKKLRTYADMAREYARHAQDRTMELDAIEIRIRAERRLGEILKVERDAGRLATRETAVKSSTTEELDTLTDIGVDKKLSARAGKLAGWREPEFEAEVAQWRELIEAGLDRPKADIMRAKQRREQREAAEAMAEPSQIDEVYPVIVIDPPWPMGRIHRNVRPNQTGLDYPTMGLDEIGALDIPATPDCHLFLWTTQKFLPPALDIAGAWGFRYVCLFTWHKPGGFQPVGLPQYNAEHVVYARKGSPTFRDTKAFPLCFSASRGAHSEKPTEFYDMIRRVTEGPRIDMFGRRDISGFKPWGNQAPRPTTPNGDAP